MAKLYIQITCTCIPTKIRRLTITHYAIELQWHLAYLPNWPSDETTTHIRELDGELRSEEEVLNRWREYFNNLLDQWSGRKGRRGQRRQKWGAGWREGDWGRGSEEGSEELESEKAGEYAPYRYVGRLFVSFKRQVVGQSVAITKE